MYNDNGPDWVARVMIALVEETVGVHGMKNQSPGCHVGNGIESGGLQGWWRKVERDRGKEDVVVAVRSSLDNPDAQRHVQARKRR